MLINAKNLIAGRLATYVAKQALNGETVDIINVESIIFTGSKSDILKKQMQRTIRGHPYKGPFYERREDRFFKRLIRGMLPYKQERGRLALKRIKCHVGVPDEFKDKKAETVPSADISKTKTLKYVRLGEICRLIGKK